MWEKMRSANFSQFHMQQFCLVFLGHNEPRQGEMPWTKIRIITTSRVWTIYFMFSSFCVTPYELIVLIFGQDISTWFGLPVVRVICLTPTVATHLMEIGCGISNPTEDHQRELFNSISTALWMLVATHSNMWFYKQQPS